MFDVKLGKLIVKEVEGKIRNSNRCKYSDERLSKIGRTLVRNTELFIDTMNKLNVNLSIDKEFEIDSYNFNELSKLVMSELIEDIIETKNDLKYLGKIAWNNVLYGFDEYENISSSITNATDNFFVDLGKLIKNNKDLLSELEDYKKGSIEFVSDDNISEMKKCLNVVICDYLTNYFFSIKDCQWINKEDITDDQIGALAWNYIYEDTDEYEALLPKDLDYLKKNSKLIWDNINDDKKEFVKDYLLNPSKYSEDDDSAFSVWEEIQNSVDKIVISNLNYYYLQDGKWDKLSNLGSMIWYMAMKYDSTFTNVSKDVELEDNFISCMEVIAKNISNDYSVQDGVNRYSLYNSLTNMLKLVHDNSYLEWCEYDYYNNSSWTDRQYDEMLLATNKMITECLSHLLKWNEDELVWTLIDNEEDYYLELTKKALNDEIEYEVVNSETGEHETLDIYFKNIGNFEDYQPNIILWFDFINDRSCKSTGVISDIVSMNDNGYSCGLDIAYNGVSCSKKTGIIMNNVLELLVKKGCSYKMKKDEHKNCSENNDSLNEKTYVYCACNKSSINVNFDSELEVLDMVNDTLGKKITLSCMLPYLSKKNELKILTKIDVLYVEKYNKYTIIEEYIGVNDDKVDDKFIGVNKEELIEKISTLCYTHMRNEEVVRNF